MSDNRKYYYLKLKENYFDDDSIVLLESMQDGVLDVYKRQGVGGYGETPEEYLCRMETLHELMAVLDTCTAVSYTHLDVYKRQGAWLSCPLLRWWWALLSCSPV